MEVKDGQSQAIDKCVRVKRERGQERSGNLDFLEESKDQSHLPEVRGSLDLPDNA